MVVLLSFMVLKMLFNFSIKKKKLFKSFHLSKYNIRISERRKFLLSQIDEVRRTRALQRASRKRRGGSHGQGLATVAVVGYTNAVGYLDEIMPTSCFNFIFAKIRFLSCWFSEIGTSSRLHLVFHLQ